MLKNGHLGIGFALLTQLAAPAGAADVRRTPVDQFAPLLRAALDAPDGMARGILTGRLAAATSIQYRTSAPINIDVSTVVRYRQEGCARLRVDVSQQDVKLNPTAAPGPQHLRFELNYCRDGLPPRSLAMGAPR
jgi:hypothetical protein